MPVLTHEQPLATGKAKRCSSRIPGEEAAAQNDPGGRGWPAGYRDIGCKCHKLCRCSYLRRSDHICAARPTTPARDQSPIVIAESNQLSVRLEVQADSLAFVWAHWAQWARRPSRSALGSRVYRAGVLQAPERGPARALVPAGPGAQRAGALRYASDGLALRVNGSSASRCLEYRTTQKAL
jgi:hypothetical protein